jgi:hypothetical protein
LEEDLMDFSKMTVEEMNSIIEEKKEVDIIVNYETVLSSDSKIDLTKPRELPPTTLILTAEGLAQLLVHGPPDEKGRWMIFVAYTYALGGRVLLSKHGQAHILANIRW